MGAGAPGLLTVASSLGTGARGGGMGPGGGTTPERGRPDVLVLPASCVRDCQPTVARNGTVSGSNVGGLLVASFMGRLVAI